MEAKKGGYKTSDPAEIVALRGSEGRCFFGEYRKNPIPLDFKPIAWIFQVSGLREYWSFQPESQSKRWLSYTIQYPGFQLAHESFNRNGFIVPRLLKRGKKDVLIASS
jgi:hypothetical protein